MIGGIGDIGIMRVIGVIGGIGDIGDIGDIWGYMGYMEYRPLLPDHMLEAYIYNDISHDFPSAQVVGVHHITVYKA